MGTCYCFCKDKYECWYEDNWAEIRQTNEGKEFSDLETLMEQRQELAITSKINEIEQEAYRSGYVAGGVEILNASCEICHAYPMTADCNNANCHAIEI